MPADLGLGEDSHAVARAEWVGAPGDKERGDIGVQRPAGLDLAVVLDIHRVAERRPPVAVVEEIARRPPFDRAVTLGIGWPGITGNLGVSRQAAPQHYQRRHRNPATR